MAVLNSIVGGAQLAKPQGHYSITVRAITLFTPEYRNYCKMASNISDLKISSKDRSYMYFNYDPDHCTDNLNNNNTYGLWLQLSIGDSFVTRGAVVFLQ